MSAASGRSPVIAGLGVTEMGKVYGRTAARFAADAVRLAAADAGLALGDIDGLLVSAGVTRDVGLDLAKDLGLRDLGLLSEMNSYGSTAGAMVQYAAMAVRSGMADTVACVFGDAPLRPDRGSGAAYRAATRRLNGWQGLMAATGLLSTNQLYAIAARRHMDRYGTTSEQLGVIAVAQREWAALNPLAQLRDPITLPDHQASRWIAEPFHLLDCCLASNGGTAVIVTPAERAAALAQPPVHVLGWAQSHPGRSMERDDDFGLVSGAAKSGPAALAMAGITLAAVVVVELYVCYTFTALL
ncbi:thiolase family protein, partial [Streptomyces sp. GbtcB7]|uniref:thiolase family protein n=1 Tax=Streptomyces sp. GbtcB7 TaxID=2824752 RepID=UPI001C30FEDC